MPTNWAEELGNAFPPFLWVVVPYSYSQRAEFAHARYPLSLFPHMPDHRLTNKEINFQSGSNLQIVPIIVLFRTYIVRGKRDNVKMQSTLKFVLNYLPLQ